MPPISASPATATGPSYTPGMSGSTGPADEHHAPRRSTGPSPRGEGPPGVSAAEGARRATLDAEAFESLRRYLFAIAYRMLGSATEAEDIVQDAYLRARDVPSNEIQSLKAYLATVVTRLCLDQLRSARAQREVYVGPWLPEPVPTADVTVLPAEATEQAEEISLAFLLLLERLTPEERATYVLREAFAYPYDEIGATLGKSSAAVRQLSHRAKERVAAGRPRFQVSPEQQRRLATRFLDASRAGDVQALADLLTQDASGWTDAGAALLAARHAVRGRDYVSRFLAGVMSKWFRDAPTTFAEVNGGIACLFWHESALIRIVMLDTNEDGIYAIHSIINPDKLAYLERRLQETATATASD